MNATERIAGLQETAYVRTPIEDELLFGEVASVAPVITASPGHTAPLMVTLETGRIAYFKRFIDQDPNMCSHYGHHPYEVPLNEVCAWRLAWAMGGDSRKLVPTAVLRTIDEFGGGALINGVEGRCDFTELGLVPRQIAAAAFWDAVVGNQDRNARNFRYDGVRRRLGLIDHGYAFARPGDLLNQSSMFLALRHRQPAGSTLTTDERTVLEEIVNQDLHGIRDIVSDDRADALEARAERMLKSGCVLPVAACF